MAFNNLFLTFEKLENENILVKRKKRGVNQKDIYLGIPTLVNYVPKDLLNNFIEAFKKINRDIIGMINE